MTFIPYTDKIEFRPIKNEGPIASVEKDFLEMGEVLQVGSDVTWVRPGDTIFFASHGVWETPEVDGVVHYVIPCTPEFILGKIEHVATEQV